MGTPSETSTRLSQSTTRLSTPSTASSVKQGPSSDISTVRKPRMSARSPNATPVPPPSTAVKRLSTSIPSLAGRRISAPVQNFPRIDPGKSVNVTSPLSKSVVGHPNGTPPPTKSSPSVSGSLRSVRSTSLYLPESPLLLRNPQDNTDSTQSPLQRSRVVSTPPRRTTLTKSTSTSSGLHIASPSVSLISSTSQAKPVKSSHSPSTPPKLLIPSDQSTPSKHPTPRSTPRSKKTRNGVRASTLPVTDFSSSPPCSHS